MKEEAMSFQCKYSGMARVKTFKHFRIAIENVVAFNSPDLSWLWELRNKKYLKNNGSGSAVHT